MMAKDEEQETKIGNFQIDVRNEVTIVAGTEETSAVKFILRFDDGTSSGEIIVPLTGPEGLAKLNWYDLHPYVQIHLRFSKAQQLLANEIRAQLPAAEKETIYRISKLGTSIVDGEAVFNAGGGFIRPPSASRNRVTVSLDPSKYILDIDPNLSEAEAVAEMMNIVRLSPDAGRVIFSHSLLYVMRKAYEAAWKSPCCILFLYGYTGTKKTTYSAFMTQLYNRGKSIEDPPRLNATASAAEKMLYEKGDCAIVLDDLFPVRFRDMKAKQEKTFLEITRIAADGVGKARMKGKEVFLGVPTCGVIFTGEYLIGSGSDAARLLPIQFTTPIDDAKLGECQAKPLALSTFYSFFIQWYVENYDSIQAHLKQWWCDYQEFPLSVHGRLRETHFFLNTSYRLFLNYCVDKGFITLADKESEQPIYEDILTGLVQAQHKRIKQDETNTTTKVDAFKLIRILYKGNSLRLAKSKKRFSGNPEDYDGLVHNGLLCLRSDKLIMRFKKEGYTNSLSDIRNTLISNEALWLDGEGKNKKIGNMRVLGIVLNKLN